MTPKARIRMRADNVFLRENTKECCEVCGSYDVDPAHHFYFKGSTKHLRYYKPNAVTLCGNCHHKLHHGGLKLEIEAMIIDVRGDEWFDDLQAKANTKQKSGYLTLEWYKEQYNKLK